MMQPRTLDASECVRGADRKNAPRYTRLHRMVEERRNGVRLQEQEDTSYYDPQETDFDASDGDSEADRGSASGRSSPAEDRGLPSRSYMPQMTRTTKLVWRREPARSSVPLLCLMGDTLVWPPLLPRCVAYVKAMRGMRVEQLTSIIESRGRAHSPPPIVMLHVGSNNLATDSCQLLVARLVDLLNVTRTAFPGAIIFLNGILHRHDSSPAMVNMVNLLMREKCDHTRTVFIDTNKFISYSHLDGDGVHLNVEGHIALYKMISRVIDIVFK